MSDCHPPISPPRGDDPIPRAAALFRHALLRTARDFSRVQDHLDCAALALQAGLPEAARQIHLLAFLRLGFAPGQIRLQDDIAASGGHVDAARARALFKDADRRAGSAVDVALHELRGLRDLAPTLDPLPEDGGDFLPSMPGALPGEGSVAGRHSRGGSPAAAIEALYRILRSPYDAATHASLAELLDRLRADILETPRPDVIAHAGDDLPALTDAFTHASLRHFLRRTEAFARPPFGSTALFHHAARLSPAGLGAYCGNISHIGRDSADMFGLVQAAAGSADDRAADDRWIVLLATGLHRWRLHLLVETLGDRGMLRPLWGIFATALQAADGAANALDRDLLLMLRDAGLDHHDMRLAAESQRIVAARLSDNGLEWRILGEIHASAGETDLAEEAFAQGLLRAPGDMELAARVRALRGGDFTPYAVRAGYGDRSRWRKSQVADAFAAYSRPPLPIAAIPVQAAATG